MQKMQAAAGGKGRGAGGMPTPAQIQAMQVSVHGHIIRRKSDKRTAFYAAWDATTNAKTTTWWRGHAGDDEGYDARARRRSSRYGSDGT